ncbi:MAG: hypothetical protein ABI927_02640 [Gaiellaceae bacterium]
MADDWRVRVVLEDDESRGAFSRLLGHEFGPDGEELAKALSGQHLAVSGEDNNLFVYANTRRQADHAHSLIGSELRHHGIEAVESRVEHWLAAEERWDNEEPLEETWEEDALDHGYAPWEVRVTCRSHSQATQLAETLERGGYEPVRRWTHLIVGTSTREEADALAARLHGEVEAGGAVVWDAAIDSHLVRPFVFFG